ncbi:MAG: 30S ribosomal protein S2 [Patescibacteria group bacterium]|jgi:small subunit ribosomal protein S2
MREVSQLEMLKRGVHFGHRESRWHPKMKPYIFTARQGIHIINLEKTSEKLAEAYAFIKQKAAEGANILFIGTKRQAQPMIREAAERVHMPYVIQRWLGGTLTNFATISKLIKKLKQLRIDRDAGDFSKYTKKEQLDLEREIARLELCIGGIENLEKIPDVLFVEDVKQEGTAVREAKKMHVPIVALVDSNANPQLVDYPIPANDDATKSLELFITLMAEAVEEGKAVRAQAAVAPAVSVQPTVPAPVSGEEPAKVDAV